MFRNWSMCLAWFLPTVTQTRCAAQLVAAKCWNRLKFYVVAFSCSESVTVDVKALV